MGLSSPRLEDVNSQNSKISKIERPDLIEKVYVYRWIQGDYNGDGKTDIGIFHLKERYWYYAMTEGTVPDMINKVRNGIGGIYEMLQKLQMIKNR